MVTDRRYGYGEPYITPRDGKMTNDKAVNIETTSTRLVYENRWMQMREDTIRFPDGSSRIYGRREA